MNRHVRDGVVLDGHAVRIVRAILASPAVRALLGALQGEARHEMAAVVDALARAEAAQRTRAVAVDGNAETETGDSLPALGNFGTQMLDTRQAADILGLTPRRVRQLAGLGLGSRIGGRWLFDPDAVAALAAARQTLEARL